MRRPVRERVDDLDPRVALGRGQQLRQPAVRHHHVAVHVAQPLPERLFGGVLNRRQVPDVALPPQNSHPTPGETVQRSRGERVAAVIDYRQFPIYPPGRPFLDGLDAVERLPRRIVYRDYYVHLRCPRVAGRHLVDPLRRPLPPEHLGRALQPPPPRDSTLALRRALQVQYGGGPAVSHPATDRQPPQAQVDVLEVPLAEILAEPSERLPRTRRHHHARAADRLQVPVNAHPLVTHRQIPETVNVQPIRGAEHPRVLRLAARAGIHHAGPDHTGHHLLGCPQHLPKPVAPRHDVAVQEHDPVALRLARARVARAREAPRLRTAHQPDLVRNLLHRLVRFVVDHHHLDRMLHRGRRHTRQALLQAIVPPVDRHNHREQRLPVLHYLSQLRLICRHRRHQYSYHVAVRVPLLNRITERAHVHRLRERARGRLLRQLRPDPVARCYDRALGPAPDDLRLS